VAEPVAVSPSQRPIVLYDFNGVIADDEPVHQMLSQQVLAEEGITITEAEYHDIYLGFDDRGCFTEAFRRAGRPIDAAGVDALIRRKSALYDAHVDRLPMFPGAVESVKAVGDRYPLGIVSGALRGEIERICRRAGIADRFAFVVASEDTAECKPHPEGYLKALALWNLRLAAEGERAGPEACVVIEDSVAGVASAKAAGMRCVAVTHSYRPDELKAADRVIEAMDRFTPELVAELLA
jgi:beta-phosphoglucomutase-like phosphatase (HAD superfamily)